MELPVKNLLLTIGIASALMLGACGKKEETESPAPAATPPATTPADPATTPTEQPAEPAPADQPKQ